MKTTFYNDEIDFITEKEVLAILKIGRTTLWRLRAKNKINTYQIEGCKRVYFKLTELKNILIPKF